MNSSNPVRTAQSDVSFRIKILKIPVQGRSNAAFFFYQKNSCCKTLLQNVDCGPTEIYRKNGFGVKKERDVNYVVASFIVNRFLMVKPRLRVGAFFCLFLLIQLF